MPSLKAAITHFPAWLVQARRVPSGAALTVLGNFGSLGSRCSIAREGKDMVHCNHLRWTPLQGLKRAVANSDTEVLAYVTRMVMSDEPSRGLAT